MHEPAHKDEPVITETCLASEQVTYTSAMSEIAKHRPIAEMNKRRDRHEEKGGEECCFCQFF
jgi:hypothetical protein